MTATPEKQQLGKGFRIALIAVVALAALYALYMFVIAPLLSGEDQAADPLATEVVAAPEATQPPAGTASEAASEVASDVGAEDAEATAEAASEAPEPPADTATEEAPLPETFEVFTARDPFQQLVEPDSGTGEATQTQSEAASSETATATPTSTAAATPTTTTTTTTTDATQESKTGLPATRVGETIIRIVDVTPGTDGVERANVTVNGAGYTVAEGETFATSFKVLDITDQCATLLYGDSRFSLCAGEEIRK